MLKRYYITLSLLILCGAANAQLLTGLSGYRNQLFVNAGYNHSFGTYGLGWYHKEHIGFLKRDLVSILDVNFPVSKEFYTRFVFRKGLQMDIWKDSTWRIPVSIIGSSDKVITNLFRIHDFATSLFLNPGIYTNRYTLALDCDWTVIWYAAFKQKDRTATSGTSHVRTRLSLGLAYGRNIRRFTMLLRAGYQPRVNLEKHPVPFYALLQAGLNCNFRKRK